MTIQRTCIIYDLDGTISDDLWRREKFLSSDPASSSWEDYFVNCAQDNLINSHLIDFNDDIVIMTGRPEYVRSQTVAWLRRVGIMPTGNWKNLNFLTPYDYVKSGRILLFMRSHMDLRPNWEVKQDMVKKFIRKNPDTQILIAYDDDPAVIKMYRRQGIPCQLITKG